MIEQFKQYMSQIVDLGDVELELIDRLLPVKKYKKGEFLLKEGEVSDTFFFNLKGFIRLFYVVDGEDRTAYFYPENCFVSAYMSFVKQVPSTFNLQATEDTTVVEISLEAIPQLLAGSAQFEALARIAMEDELINHQKMVAALLTLSPEERYYQLLEDEPEISQRVPQRQIASYIGVKPESLSRIKKRHWERKS